MFKIADSIELEQFNTMAIPAVARHYCVLSNVSELPPIIEWAQDHQLPILVLGDGSNTIFAGDVSGLVLHNRLKGVEVLNSSSSSVVRVAGGENWHAFVNWCLDHQFFGLENLALIPGTVGAAPIQNIGAYGVEVERFIHAVHVVDLTTGAARTFTHDDCQFEYRESAFKKRWRDQYIITHVDFIFPPEWEPVNHYPSLQSLLPSNPTPHEIFDTVCDLRRSKLPDPQNIPNSGSFFKNPVVSESEYQRLLNEHPDLVAFSTEQGHKLAAGWLIENAGWKQRQIDDVTVHQQQALVVVNPKHRSGKEVLRFAYTLQADVLTKYGVALEIEPRIVC